MSKRSNVLRQPWQQKYDAEYAKKVDDVIERLDVSRSISKIPKAMEKRICPNMITKKEYKILCKEIGRALEYYSNGADTSIYSLKCNEPREND